MQRIQGYKIFVKGYFFKKSKKKKMMLISQKEDPLFDEIDK